MQTLCALLLFLASLSASAVSIEVIGREIKPIFSHEIDADLSKSVGYHTILEFETAVLKYEGTEAGIVSINNLKNEIEVISDKEMLSYGWCYSVNDLAPDFMPDQIFFTSQKDILKWFYAYSEYKNGVWVSQCVPVVRRSH